MQKRHTDRKIYFQELANTSRKYYIDYISKYIKISDQIKVLEVGCGEGGNLLPFAEKGCSVVGIDINAKRIEQARSFFADHSATGTFMCENFVNIETPKDENEKFDLVLLHDVIEHISQEHKQEVLENIKRFLKKDGIVFIGFPAWQMPYGGHHQICRGFASKLPYIHVLPKGLYKRILLLSKENDSTIEELLDIKRCKMTIEKFEVLVSNINFDVLQKTFWFINPHYEEKFKLKPRKLFKPLWHAKYIRNYFITSAFYLLQKR